ncbi:MAG TPA: AI-2E family transporter [Actinomycetes bacterium]|nr:AI-2E family transporter [Actinomycetes bacterium]
MSEEDDASQQAAPARAEAADLPHEEQLFGRPGRPLRRDSPFMLGFLGALGVFVAWFLTQAVVEARGVIVLIVVSLFLAIGLNPGVEWLMSRGMRRGMAIAIVFFAVIGAFVGFGFAVAPPVVEQSNEFVDALPTFLDDLRKNSTVRQLDDDFGVIERAKEYVTSKDLGQRLFGGIVGVGRIVLSTVFSAFTLLIMTLYFLAALPSMKRQAYRLVPATRRERVTLLTDEILSRIGGFVSGAFTVAFIAALTSYVFLRIVDVPYALVLALVVGLLDLVPLIGATIGAVVVSLIGFTESAAVGVACVVFYVAYQQFENYVVYPRVMRRAVDVPAPVTVVAALLGGALLGIVGALIAIPVAAAVLLVVRQVAIPRMDRV